jgi:hypothetical protein
VRYRQCVRRVASGGISSVTFLGSHVYMLTLTAPGDREHRLPSGRLCRCTPIGGVDKAAWNTAAVAKWNDLVTDLARLLGVDVQYFKAVEVQKRGALHLHVLMRLALPCGITMSKLRQLAIRHGFGHEVDLRVADGSAAAYVAKYVSKSSADRACAPVERRWWGLYEARAYRWRTWTASRRWGESMASVRTAQSLWWAQRASAGDGDEVDVPAAPLDHRDASYAQSPSDLPLVGGLLSM